MNAKNIVAKPSGSITNAYGIYFTIRTSDLAQWQTMIARAEHGAEVCVEINGVAREMTLAEFAARLGFDVPTESP